VTRLTAVDLVIRDAPNDPIFVGGTGRSGTTIAGRLLGHHRDVGSTNPRELRFIASSGGLADAYSGRCTPETVAKNMFVHWFERVKPSGVVSGLYRRVSRDEMQALLDDYVSAFPSDPYAASRRFAETVISSRVKRDPEGRWVDTTPANARAADRVLALFPEGRVVHMMRDGRDVAASFVSKPFGPDEVFTGLDEWRARMIEAHEAEQRAPAGRVFRVDLEELAATRREESLDALLDFLSLADDRRMRDWFDKKVVAAQAHVGRWRKDYDDDTAHAIDERYAQIIAELDARGVPHP
jgi:hypothetical protein